MTYTPHNGKEKHTFQRKKKSNLPDQDLSCSIFNEDVSFQSIIKGRVSSRGACAADPRVLGQKPGENDSVTSKESFAAICWKNIVNDYLLIERIIEYSNQLKQLTVCVFPF